MDTIEEATAWALARLQEFVRIPSESGFTGAAERKVHQTSPFTVFEPSDAERVAALKRSAQFAEAMLKEIGARTEIVSMPGKDGMPDPHPYVIGWIDVDERLPTVLLYAHHDVQPIADPSRWKSNPYEATFGDHKGPFTNTGTAAAAKKKPTRLYGRGAADDKAGLMVHVAAVRAYLKEGRPLPVNIVFLVEGEEEVGSDNLPRFLRSRKKDLKCDALVLTDSSNLFEGIPSITYRLRGVVAARIRLSGLAASKHSGMWGGPVPDAALLLSHLLSRLAGPDNLPTFGGTARISPRELKQLRALPYDEAILRQQAGVRREVKLAGSKHSILERLWTLPTMTITGMKSGDVNGSNNIVNDVAEARVVMRVAAEQNPDKFAQAFSVAVVKEARALGIELRVLKPRDRLGDHVNVVQLQQAGAGAVVDPNHPALQAASRAFAKGYGKGTQLIGVGGSIPFMQAFMDSFGVPAILMGIEDQYSNAHGENESLSLGDFGRAVSSSVYLYEELAKVL